MSHKYSVGTRFSHEDLEFEILICINILEYLIMANGKIIIVIESAINELVNDGWLEERKENVSS